MFYIVQLVYHPRNFYITRMSSYNITGPRDVNISTPFTSLWDVKCVDKFGYLTPTYTGTYTISGMATQIDDIAPIYTKDIAIRCRTIPAFVGLSHMDVGYLVGRLRLNGVSCMLVTNSDISSIILYWNPLPFIIASIILIIVFIYMTAKRIVILPRLLTKGTS